MASRWVFNTIVIVEQISNNPVEPETLKKYCESHGIRYSQPADANSPAVIEIKL